MSKFTDSAKASLGGSKIMQGRTKIATDELIRRYPSGVTINGFDVIPKADGGDFYPVLTFAEDDALYFNGGSIAKKIVDGWIQLANGDIEQASDELKQSGGVKFRLSYKKTKQGKTLVAYDTVE